MAGAVKAFYTVVLLTLVGIFGYAGVIKVGAPDVFLKDVLSYRILPYELAWVVAFLIPMLEVVCALALLLPRLRAAAAWILGTLMLVFTAALLSAWARGLDISCGCFGSSDTPANYPMLLIRDILLVMGCACVALFDPGKKKTPS